MGIFDTVLIHPDIRIDKYPFDESRRDTGRWRGWNTHDLNPSMDHYMIRPSASDKTGPELVRRHPPVTKWTTVHDGFIEGEDVDIVADADHWRQTRFNGQLELTDIGDDHRHYTVLAEFRAGHLTDITLDSYAHIVANEIPDEYKDLGIDLSDE